MKVINHIVWVLLFGVVVACGIYALRNWWRAREDEIIQKEIIQTLRVPHCNDDGFWVGDITELHRLGKISRELAEADTAPLNPLVPKPIPFHGYYVRAMDSGPSMSTKDPTPVSFKGQKRSRDNFAILIYPAEPGPGKHTWITNRLSLLHRSDNWTPVFTFPTEKERIAQWGTVD